MALKSLLVRYTRNHIEECEKLEKDIGSVQALSTTIAGMKNIELLKVSSGPIAQKTSKACNTLVKLVNKGGKLIHEYNISSNLIRKTKMDVLAIYPAYLSFSFWPSSYKKNPKKLKFIDESHYSSRELKEKKCHLPEVSDFPLGKTYNTIVLSSLDD
ncbi:hypothetical protein ACTFIR_001886 [Dictyostelium discoideum]